MQGVYIFVAACSSSSSIPARGAGLSAMSLQITESPLDGIELIYKHKAEKRYTTLNVSHRWVGDSRRFYDLKSTSKK
jgi:hypothetical protein